MFSFLKRRGSGKAEPEEVRAESRVRVATAMLSDIGCHRTINEDSGKIVHPGDPEEMARKGILVAVADGMGGHEAGEVASRMAVETVARVYYASPEGPGAALAAGFHEANREIHEFAGRKPELTGMGTTCSVLAVAGDAVCAAHVGDSRIYLVRRGAIYQLSEDHSEVMQMVRQGLLTLEEARRHEDRNVLLRALGTRAEVEVSGWSEPMPVFPGDRFALSSDGLHDGVREEEIRDAVVEKDPQAACQWLVELARQRGGYDNITVAVVAFETPRETPARDLRETRNLGVLK
jgi:protein phosphatase